MFGAWPEEAWTTFATPLNGPSLLYGIGGVVCRKFRNVCELPWGSSERLAILLEPAVWGRQLRIFGKQGP